MKLSLTNWVIRSVKQNNDEVLNVEKQHYIFVNVALHPECFKEFHEQW